MTDKNPVANPAPQVATVQTAPAVPKPLSSHAKTHTKVFNTHSDKTAQVKVVMNGKDDYVTVMPRGKVDLPVGTTVHADEFKNPNLRIV